MNEKHVELLAEEDDTVKCWHRHRSQKAIDECARLRARPRCVQCGALVSGNLGAVYDTGAVTCGDCHWADFG